MYKPGKLRNIQLLKDLKNKKNFITQRKNELLLTLSYISNLFSLFFETMTN